MARSSQLKRVFDRQTMNDVQRDEAQMDRARVSFFSSGMQYYISGRYAVLARLVPVAGNLLHHAIEMFLKGGLAPVADLNELRRLGHNVPNMWRLFKERLGQRELDRFDSVITSVNAFEELRLSGLVDRKWCADHGWHRRRSAVGQVRADHSHTVIRVVPVGDRSSGPLNF